MARQIRSAARYHGDQASGPSDLGRYPGADDVACDTSAVAQRHGREVAEPEAALAAAGVPEAMR